MIEPRFRLRAINQVCLVVQDLERTMEAYWCHMGIGPWRVYTYGPPMVKDPTYRGEPEPYHMRIALAQVGDMVVELIQHLDGRTIYRDFTDRAGEGLHHIGIFVENLSEAVEQMRQAGFRVIQSGCGYGVHGDGGFAYLDTEEELGTVWELIEVPSERFPPERIYPS